MITVEQKNFIEKFGKLMKAEANKRGYSIVSTALAQTILEGNWGKSKLAQLAHNHWGLKCGSSWKGESINMKTKEEYSVGTLTDIRANFRKYPSDEAGVVGYYDFISANKRYANLKKARNYVEYAQMLKSDGYATSSTYIKSLCDCVVKYNLTDYDIYVPILKRSYEYAPILKRSNKYDPNVKVLQNLINTYYRQNVLKVDGYFGPVTESWVVRFQEEKKLKIDGIVGPKTWGALLEEG